MTANEFCSLQHCRNYGCSKLNRDKDLCMEVDPPAKPSAVRRGIDCKIQTPRWSIKDCRAKKCDFLGTEELINGGRCCLFGGRHSTMPGTLTRCLQDPEMPPEELLDKIPLPPIPGEKEEDDDTPYCYRPRKSPGIKNCPDLCPYKLIEEVEGSGKRKIKKGTCAFCGETLGGGCGICHTTILDSGDLMNAQIGLIGAAFERRSHPPSSETCGGYCCPDGVYRCEKGETSCPLIKVPFADLPACPLWRIPAKLLPALVAEPEKPQTSEKDMHLSSVPPTIKKETEKPPKTKKPIAEKRTKKEKPDPICEACRERHKDPIEDYQCTWCKEQQEKHGRRGWTTTLQMGEVHLGDMNDLGKQIPADSIDLIFTDPAYVKDQYQEAYANLAELALRVLKPNGFLITYAPQTHLDEIMDMLRYTGTWLYGGKLQYFWIIESLNEGQSTAKNHQRNAICLHKPILVFQKAHEGEPLKGSRRCFSDVVRGRRQKKFHPWQQSIHDVLGIISRFMDPGEILLDPYAGTGTSLIAANLLGMDWIGFEIDPKTHAIAVRELQQTPINLHAFGIEAPAAECEREPAPEQKDTSKQAVIEPAEISSKKRSRIEKQAPDIKTKPEECKNCSWMGTCPDNGNPHNPECIDRAATDYASTCDDDIDQHCCQAACDAYSVCKRAHECLECIDFNDCEERNPGGPECKRSAEPADPATGVRPVELHAACLDCEAVDRCMRHDPHANCLQEFLDFEKAVEEGKQPPKLYGAEKNCETCKGYGGGIILRDCPSFKDIMAGKVSVDDLITSTKKEGCGDWKAGIKIAPQKTEKFVQHCCGTCGHHKGRKTFHESCPRLSELLFKGGTKSAKVLMDETAATPCEHWTDIPGDLYVPEKIRDCFGKDYGTLGGIARCADCSDHDECYKTWTKNERKKNSCCAGVPKKKKVKADAPPTNEPETPAAKPKKDTPEWFAMLTETKRRNNPQWLWEVWKHDPAKGEWLYEGTEIQTEAYALKERIEETRPEGSKVLFSVRKRPDPNYDPNDIEGPCKACTIECLDDNDGCHEFDEHSQKLDGDGESPGEWPDWPVCIISCGKAKIWDNPGKKKPKAFVYAKDAYTGPLFTSAKNYAEQRHRGPWYILSDKYGLILPGEEIENYDVSPEEIKDDPEFFEAVHHRARSDPDLSRAKKIVLIAGKIHQDIIERIFPGVEIYNPVQGLSQGERMHVLKNLTAESPAAEKSNCGGKRPALNRCPDSCPDRICEKEGGYPQGRCKQTGQKLREMQTCPNDPPKKSASKKSKKESETP